MSYLFIYLWNTTNYTVVFMAVYYITFINPKCIQQDNLSSATIMPYNNYAIQQSCHMHSSLWETFQPGRFARATRILQAGEVYNMQVLLYTTFRFLLYQCTLNVLDASNLYWMPATCFITCRHVYNMQVACRHHAGPVVYHLSFP